MVATEHQNLRQDGESAQEPVVRVVPEGGRFVIYLGPSGFSVPVGENADPDAAMRAARQLAATVNHLISTCLSIPDPVLEPAR